MKYKYFVLTSVVFLEWHRICHMLWRSCLFLAVCNKKTTVTAQNLHHRSSPGILEVAKEQTLHQSWMLQQWYVSSLFHQDYLSLSLCHMAVILIVRKIDLTREEILCCAKCYSSNTLQLLNAVTIRETKENRKDGLRRSPSLRFFLASLIVKAFKSCSVLLL